MNGLPIVALVGRPNVGKSTLFNRLVGRPQAIVEDEPGTTRDRVYGTAIWNDKPFMVVDTGGIDFAPTSDMTRDIRRQAVHHALGELFALPQRLLRLLARGDVNENEAALL